MASTVSKKRSRRTPTSRPRKPVPLDEERIKQLMKQAVREVLQEEREQQGATPLRQPSQSEQEPRARVDPLRGKNRAEMIALARQAEGSWKESEGAGTAVEIVRRLRDEWKHRP